MLSLIKIFTSALVITLVTEVAKRHTLAAGIIAALPINIAIVLIWLYFEKKDPSLLADFTQSAFFGLFSTFVFLVLMFCVFKKMATQV